MYLHKTKRSPFYQLIYFVDGKRKTISTKQTSKKEALHFLHNFQFQPIQEKAKTNITLSEFEKEYVEFLSSSRSKSYLKSVKLSFRQLNYFTGDIYLSQLYQRVLERFIAKCYIRSKSAATLYYRTLKAAFNKAVDWEYISTSPLSKIKTPKVPKKIPKFFSAYDIELILENTKDDLMKDIIVFAFNTGMRAGEIVNLEWGAIDIKEKLIYVRNTGDFVTKSGKERIIPMNNHVYRVIKSTFSKQKDSLDINYLFLRNGYIKLTQDYISKKFKSILRKLDFEEDLHFHSLRHSFASNLVQRSVPIYVVKELLGHTSITTTQIYSHLEKENLIVAVASFN